MVSLASVTLFMLVCLGIVFLMFKTGYKLRH